MQYSTYEVPGKFAEVFVQKWCKRLAQSVNVCLKRASKSLGACLGLVVQQFPCTCFSKVDTCTCLSTTKSAQQIGPSRVDLQRFVQIYMSVRETTCWLPRLGVFNHLGVPKEVFLGLPRVGMSCLSSMECRWIEVRGKALFVQRKSEMSLVASYCFTFLPSHPSPCICILPCNQLLTPLAPQRTLDDLTKCSARGSTP